MRSCRQTVVVSDFQEDKSIVKSSHGCHVPFGHAPATVHDFRIGCLDVGSFQEDRYRELCPQCNGSYLSISERY